MAVCVASYGAWQAHPTPFCGQHISGVVNIYPGLCNNHDWPGCNTGTLLAMAIPANYSDDVLLTNWSKPSFNPIMENTQRDPSSPWKEPSGPPLALALAREWDFAFTAGD